jgi:hypothetical protein
MLHYCRCYIVYSMVYRIIGVRKECGSMHKMGIQLFVCLLACLLGGKHYILSHLVVGGGYTSVCLDGRCHSTTRTEYI